MSDFHAGNLQAKAGRRRFPDFPTQIGTDPRGAGYWIWYPSSKELFLSNSISTSLRYGYAGATDIRTVLPLENLVHPEDKEKAESFFGGLRTRFSSEKESSFRIRCADDLFVGVIVRGGTELKTVESGVYLGAILRADEKREAYLESEVFEAPEEVDQEVGKSTPFERGIQEDRPDSR